MRITHCSTLSWVRRFRRPIRPRCTWRKDYRSSARRPMVRQPRRNSTSVSISPKPTANWIVRNLCSRRSTAAPFPSGSRVPGSSARTSCRHRKNSISAARIFDRGFYFGQVTGDSALEATVEPLLDTKLPPAPFLKLPLSAEFYGFYDWGETWENLKEDQDHVLRSLGGGVRFYVGDRGEIDLEGVSRLTRTPNGEPPLVSRLRSSVFYWQVLARF